MEAAVVCTPPVALEGLCRRIRRHVVEMVALAGSGHPGGSLSAVELLVALYFGGVMRHRPEDPEWPDRDRFVLSKGHITPAFYAVLAEAGYFPLEELRTFRRFGSRLQGHPSRTLRAPGVEVQAGSLGHGLAIALGLALGLRHAGRRSRVWVLLGDGECQEGEVWETAMAASHFGVSNLTAIVDYNKVQQDGTIPEVMEVAPLADKWRSFGWAVREVDGHRLDGVLSAYAWACGESDRPRVVIAHTVKGKGVSYMEGRPEWHGKAPAGELLERARAQLGEDGIAPWA